MTANPAISHVEFCLLPFTCLPDRAWLPDGEMFFLFLLICSAPDNTWMDDSSLSLTTRGEELTKVNDDCLVLLYPS